MAGPGLFDSHRPPPKLRFPSPESRWLPRPLSYQTPTPGAPAEAPLPLGKGGCPHTLTVRPFDRCIRLCWAGIEGGVDGKEGALRAGDVLLGGSADDRSGGRQGLLR